MSILGMETERARQAARQMDQTHQTAKEKALALRRALDRLFSAWQGGAAADFRPRPATSPHALSERLAALEELASRMGREAEE